MELKGILLELLLTLLNFSLIPQLFKILLVSELNSRNCRVHVTLFDQLINCKWLQLYKTNDKSRAENC